MHPGQGGYIHEKRLLSIEPAGQTPGRNLPEIPG